MRKPTARVVRAGVTVLLGWASVACTGEIIGEPFDPAGGAILPGTVPGNSDLLEPLEGPPIRGGGVRRLTRQEYARSIGRLLGGDVPVEVSLLPEDTLTPFDNDVLEQSPSMLLVESAETLAQDIANYVTGSGERLRRVLPCSPGPSTAGGADSGCFDQFIQRFGLRVLRRPLAPDEIVAMNELRSYGSLPGGFADAANAAPHKKVRQVAFIKVVPKSSSGQILRKDVKRKYAQPASVSCEPCPTARCPRALTRCSGLPHPFPMTSFAVPSAKRCATLIPTWAAIRSVSMPCSARGTA